MITTKIQDEARLAPNYTFTIGTLDELCRCFQAYTGTGAPIREIKKSFEKRQKKKINDSWMQRFFEAVRALGPSNKNLRIYENHNKVPLIGRAEIAKAIAGLSATLNANYIALGTGNAAPADGDTQLGAEFVRSGFQQITATNNVVYLDKFFGSAEV